MNVYYLSLKPETPCNDYWDYGFLNDFIQGEMWKPDGFPDFDTYEVRSLPKDTQAIVVIPARHHADSVDEVNDHLNRIGKVVLFLMGDEEADFPVDKIKHPNIYIWVQNPHPGRHDKYNKIGTGYPPQSQVILPTLKPAKDLDVFFAGQITHKRRTLMLCNLNEYVAHHENTLVHTSQGFTQGLNHDTYYKHLSRAKVAPCPSGAVIPDSFRTFEALESMAIPVADEINPTNTIEEYWNWLFNEETPFPKIQAYDRLVGIINEELDKWPGNIHKQTAWWIAYKRKFAYTVLEQLYG